jgi:hypothetical protein
MNEHIDEWFVKRVYKSSTPHNVSNLNDSRVDVTLRKIKTVCMQCGYTVDSIPQDWDGNGIPTSVACPECGMQLHLSNCSVIAIAQYGKGDD